MDTFKHFFLQLFISLVLLWSTIYCSNKTFEQWKNEQPENYDKAMSIKSEAAAKSAYKANQKVINRHNKKVKKSYRMGENLNVALTPSERLKYRKGYRGKKTDPTKEERRKNTNSSANNAIHNGMKNKTTIKHRKSTTKKHKTTTKNNKTKKKSTKSSTILMTTSSIEPTRNSSAIRTRTTRRRTTMRNGKREKRDTQHKRVKRYQIPDEYDISKGLSVKDQENCAASWAFAAVVLVSTITQHEFNQLLNCSTFFRLNTNPL